MRYLQVFLLLAVAGLFSGCLGPKKVIYFNNNDAVDSSTITQAARPRAEVIIQQGDILSIIVTSLSSLTPKVGAQGALVVPDEVEIYNNGGSAFNGTAASGGGGGGRGYLVNKAGEINFSVLGPLKVGGLTLAQVNEVIAERLRLKLKDPVVDTRIINYTVTILGEIPRPGPVIAPSQRISIIEAIAAAGDIPLTGRKDNIEIIRHVGDHLEIAHIDLNSRNVFTSPYFYLQQNDIIYIEPVRLRRQESNEFFRFYLPIAATLIQTGLTIFGIIQIAKAQ